MSIKTILVPLDGTDTSIKKLPTAYAAAALFGAHLEILYIERNPKDAVPFVFGSFASRELRESVITAANRDSDEQRASMEARFTEFCTAHDIKIRDQPDASQAVSASWRIAKPGDLVARGRMNDLIAIIRTPSDQTPWLLESTLLESARPVLLVPPTSPTGLGKHVVIGWNASREATRAISAALPFLTRADSITLLASRKRTASANDVIDYLRWHAIDARLHELAPASSVGAGLLVQAKQLGADLCVIGGYSRTRASQLLFGGVTQHFIHYAELPILLAH